MCFAKEIPKRKKYATADAIDSLPFPVTVPREANESQHLSWFLSRAARFSSEAKQH